jgi:hypothetical protein
MMMNMTAATVGSRTSGANDVSMATFFLQDPKCDPDYT